MLLKTMIEKNHYKFVDEVSDWKEAIKLSCEPLEKDGTVGDNYAQLIIDCVEKYGPYIVLFPHYAIPHSTEEAEGVTQSAISFMKLQKPVSFEEGNPEKDAEVFFTLAAKDKDQHVENMEQLFDMLSNEELLEELLTVKTVEDLQKLAEKY